MTNSQTGQLNNSHAHEHRHDGEANDQSHVHPHSHVGEDQLSHRHDHSDRTAFQSVRLGDLMTNERWLDVALMILTGVAAFLYQRDIVPIAVLLVAVAFGLFPLLKTGILGLVREHKIGTEIFVTVAVTIAMLGGEYVAGAVVLMIILIAEFIADLTTDRARASIKALVGAIPQTASVRRDDDERTLPISELRAGDIVLVRSGEKVPVDGIVRSGQASVNEAPITGESLAREKEVGSQVLAGTIVELGAIDVETQRIGGETLFARIVALVEQAEQMQAPVQRLADRVATWLIPVMFVFLLITYLITRDVRMTITLLIFTSPAELGLATPLVMIAAIARAARAGVLVKGGLYLEALAKVDVVVFDKTGTLTFGQPEVERIELLDSGLTESELLRLSAAADRRSGHPLAVAVVAHARRLKVEVPEPSTFETVLGKGVKATVEGRQVLLGNISLLTNNGVAAPSFGEAISQTAVYIAVDGKPVGIIHFNDRLRADAKETIANLKATGIKRVLMLTGDNPASAQRVATELGVDEVKSELLPEDKLTIVRQLQAEGHRVAMVGDGVNDAPALALADVGIAMGAAGTQAALEAADIALMTDDLSKIIEARTVAARAYRTIKENLLVGVGVVHVLGIAAALLQLIGPIEAAAIHLAPDTLVFLNSMKLLRLRI